MVIWAVYFLAANPSDQELWSLKELADNEEELVKIGEYGLEKSAANE